MAGMSATRTAAASGRRFRPARGVLAGLVAAFGALCAHVAGGGTILLVPGLVVLGVALPLGIVLTRIGRVDVPRLALIAFCAQAVGHLTLMMAPSDLHHHGHAHQAAGGMGLLDAVGLTPSMALTHLGVVAATTAVAAGLDQAVVKAVWAFLGWLVLRLLRLAALPVRGRQRVRTESAAVRSQTVRSAAVPRGPPAGTHPLVPSLRLAH